MRLRSMDPTRYIIVGLECRWNTNTIEKFKTNSEIASSHILKIISELKPKHYRNATVKYQKIISYFVLFDSPFTEMLACTTFTDFFAPSFFSWMIQMHSVDWVTFTGLVIVSFRLVTTPPQVEAAQNKTIQIHYQNVVFILKLRLFQNSAYHHLKIFTSCFLFRKTKIFMCTYTVKFLTIQTPEKYAVITLKFKQDDFTVE